MVDQSIVHKRKKKTQPHPRIANSQALRRLIAAVGLPNELPVESLVLWLPTNRFGPLLPPEMGQTMDAADEPPALCQWKITGLALDALQHCRC